MTSTILTYTIVRTPPEGVGGAPYCVAILDTRGHRETARVAGYTDDREVSIGQQVRPLPEPDRHGARYALV